MGLISIITNLGKEAMAKTFANMVSFGVSPPNLKPLGAKYFRIGEGGFRGSPEYPPVGKTPKNPDTRSGEVIATGDGSSSAFSGNFDFFPVLHDSLMPGLVKITDGVEIFTDDGAGNLIGSLGGSGTINYFTGAYSITFNSPPGSGADITAYYAWNRTGIFAEDNPLLFFFEKEFDADPETKVEYEYHEGVNTVLCTCYVGPNEAIDRGGGITPSLYEIGIFDEQGNLIAYGNFPEIKKSLGMVINLKMRLLF